MRSIFPTLFFQISLHFIPSFPLHFLQLKGHNSTEKSASNGAAGGSSGSSNSGDLPPSKPRINPISPFDEDILDIPTVFSGFGTYDQKRIIPTDSASLAVAADHNRSRRNSTSSTSSSSSSLSGGASGKTPASASGSAVPSYLLASGTAEGDKFGCDNGYELPLSEHLRPGLVVRVIGAINRSDYIVYVIRVCDVQSGVEWRTERRFREFQEFHDVVVSLRPSIARIEFPRKRYDSGHYLLLNYLSHHRK